MGLNCLLVTSDVALLHTIQNMFSGAHIELEMRTDSAAAIELSARRHLDGFVIDCDDVPGAAGVIANVRNGRSNKSSLVFAVVNGTPSSTVIEAGANFVLAKPVQDRLLRSFLEVALPMMEREHRRYFRHKVDLPVKLLCHTGESFIGRIMNVSESGLALTHFGPIPGEIVLTVQFDLPSTDRQVFQARAAVVWKDSHVMGLRFICIEPGCCSYFEAWLASLEAQERFRESIQSNNPTFGEHGQAGYWPITSRS
jgi:DNA-binding response OmpR family regulator